MKRRFLSTALISVVIAASLFTGCGKGADSSATSSEDTQAVTYVEVFNTSSDSIKNEYLYNGTIKPVDEVVVSGTIQGKVASVNFAIGDHVNAGDVLYTMDTANILNSKKVAEASLASADAGIKSAQTNLDLANGASMQTQIETTKAALDRAEIALNTAKTTYDNNKTLFENGIISQTDMDNTTDAYNNAQIAYNQAKESYNLTLQMPDENRRKAQAALDSAVAQRESVVAQINSYDQSLRDAVVKSPISGYVTEKNVDAGTVLATNEPFKISDTSKVKMSVSVSEDIVNSVTLGDSVTVNIPSAAEPNRTGVISTINPSANEGGTYDVDIEIDNADGNLKSGMFGEVNFVKDESDHTIVVPSDAVITKNNEKYVFVLKNNTAVKTIVTTGIETGTQIEITSGLKENMEVVTKGQTYINDGDHIEVVTKEDNSAKNEALIENAGNISTEEKTSKKDKKSDKKDKKSDKKDSAKDKKSVSSADKEE